MNYCDQFGINYLMPVCTSQSDKWVQAVVIAFFIVLIFRAIWNKWRKHHDTRSYRVNKRGSFWNRVSDYVMADTEIRIKQTP